MKCPVCIEQGERSTLHSLNYPVYAMAWQPYYDEDGAYHSHDPNTGGQWFVCSRGHEFSPPYKPCRSCDWRERGELRREPTPTPSAT